MEWFENWFDENYLDLYVSRNNEDAQKQVSLILENIPYQDQNKTWLDVGCGMGRHTKLFEEKGCRITGIDISKVLIGIGHKQYPQLDLRHMTVEKLIEKKNYYQVLLSLFTSFGYYSNDNDNFKFLENMSKLIIPQGFIWLDFLNAKKVMRVDLKDSWEKTEKGKFYFQKRRIINNRVEKNIEVYHQGKLEKKYLESVRLYTLKDFKKMFSQVGLTILKTFGDYEGSLYQENSSRLIILAQK